MVFPQRVRGPKIELSIANRIGCCCLDCTQSLAKNSADYFRFLWVRFQLDELCDEAHSEQSFRDTLRDLPKGLTATYSRITDKISQKPARIFEMADRIFQWTLAARRPISLEELKEAISIRTGDKTLDLARKSADLDPRGRGLLHSCGGLVVFDEVDVTIRSAHHTVNQFLIETWTDQSEADHLLGETCYTYLKFDDFQGQIIRTNLDRSGLKNNMPATSVSTLLPRFLGLSITSWVYDFARGLYKPSNKRSLPDLDYLDILNSYQPKRLASALSKRYSLLQYVVDHWMWHMTYLGSEPLEELAMIMELPFNFNFRPWGINRGPDDLPYVSLFLWAADHCHEGLIGLLENPPDGSNLGEYLRYKQEKFPFAESPIEKAIKSGNLDLIILYIRVAGIPFFDVKNLVMMAAKYGNLEALCYFLDKLDYHHNLDTTSNMYCPFHCAAVAGSVSIMRELHSRRFDLNGLDTEGRTLLMCGVCSNDPSTVDLILKWGVDVNAAGFDGKTALHEAACLRHSADIVQLLLNHGANIEAHDDEDISVMKLAIYEGSAAVVECLISNGAKINERPYSKEPLIFYALRKCSFQIEPKIKILLAHGIDPNWMDERGTTALHRIAEIGSGINVAKIFVDASADVNAELLDGSTPLHLSARKGRSYLIEFLKDCGASLVATDDRGMTALHISASIGDLVAVRTLVGAGANVQSKDNKGWTTLHYAARIRSDDTLETLLKAGANVNAVNSDGLTALQIILTDASKSKKYKSALALLEAGADYIYEERRALVKVGFTSDNLK